MAAHFEEARAPSAEEKQLEDSLEDARVLLWYATREGKLVSDETLSDIIRAQSYLRAGARNAEVEARFWVALRELAAAVKPASIDSILATYSYKFSHDSQGGRRHPVDAATTKRKYTYAAVVVLVILLFFQTWWFIGTTFHADLEKLRNEFKIGVTLLNSKFLLTTLIQYLLPLLYGLLGSLTYILRTLSSEIQQVTFTRGSEIRYALRWPLGMLAGVIVGLFFDPVGFSGLAAITPLGLAFLAGYGVELVFTGLDGLIRAFTTVSDRLVVALAGAPASDEDFVRASFGRLEYRIDSLQMNPTLDNFDGVVAVRLRDAKGHDLPVAEHRGRRAARATPGQECRAEVRFEGGDGSVHPFQSRLVIKDGNDSDTVAFEVALDSEIISFIPRGAQCTFQPARETPTLSFEFTAPEQAGRHDFFVEVTQKLRLVQVVTAAVMVVDL